MATQGAGTPAQQPQEDRGEAAYRVRLLAIVLTGTFFSVMNSSMVNVALPTLMRDFGIGITSSVWLYTGYTLPYAVTMPVFGVLGERIGSKRAFLGGVVAFLLASLLCSAAWSFPSLLVFRVVQALGAAALVPNAMVLITAAFPPTQRGQALGVWSAVSGVGAGAGPALGGLLTQYASWHAIFWVNAPFLLVLALIGRRFIRPLPIRGGQGRFDVAGSVLLAVGLGALMLGLTTGQTDGWSKASTLGLFGLTVVGLAGFLLREFRTPAPMLPIALFRTRSYATSALTIFLQSMVLFGSLLLFPIYLQSLRGHSPTEAGFMVLPLSAAMLVAAPSGGRLSDRLGPRLPTLVGMVVVAVTMVWISGLSLTSPYWQLGLAFALEGVGVGLSVSPLTSTAMNAASPQQRGAASGFFNTVRFVGAVLGTTILGVVLSDRTQTALSRVHAASFSQRHALAMLQGFHDVYLVAGAIGLLSALTALWLRPGFASAQPVVRPGRRQPTGDPSSYM